MRISTQVYVLIDGERKVMEHISQGVARAMSVDIDLDQCYVCGALLPPSNVIGRHEEWHRAQAASDG